MTIIKHYKTRKTKLCNLGGIWAASVTYTTARGNAGSLTHWARPGIELASSWILFRFLSAAPQQELPVLFILNCLIKLNRKTIWVWKFSYLKILNEWLNVFSRNRVVLFFFFSPLIPESVVKCCLSQGIFPFYPLLKILLQYAIHNILSISSWHIKDLKLFPFFIPVIDSLCLLSFDLNSSV